MRFHTRLSKMIATSLCTAGVLISTSMPAFAQPRDMTTHVVSVRTYTDGNTHIGLSDNTLCAPGGRPDILRVGGEGTALIHAIALDALQSGRTVEVAYDDIRIGAYCNLVSLRIIK
jgi:hypothetical protein